MELERTVDNLMSMVHNEGNNDEVSNWTFLLNSFEIYLKH